MELKTKINSTASSRRNIYVMTKEEREGKQVSLTYQQHSASISYITSNK